MARRTAVRHARQEGCRRIMVRTVSMVAVSIAIVGWLVLSYWPAAAAALPVVAFGSGLPVFGLTAVLFAATALLQVWIVYTTVRSLTRPVDAAQAATLRHFNLSTSAEAVLTAAPLLITLALLALILFAA